MDIKGLIQRLSGMGVKVNADENLEEFEVIEPTTPGDHAAEANELTLTLDEINALKGFAALAGKLQQNMAVIESLGALQKDLPALLAFTQNVKQQEENDRAVLITNIKASPDNVLSDDELKALATPVLVKLNARSSVNYAGLGSVGSFFANEEVLLPSYMRPEEGAK